jgi:hypothetical protein
MRGRIRLIWSWCSTSHESLLDRLVRFGQTVKSAGSFQGPGARLPPGGAGIRAGQGSFAPARRAGGSSERLAPANRVNRPASNQRPDFIGGSFVDRHTRRNVRRVAIYFVVAALLFKWVVDQSRNPRATRRVDATRKRT